MGNHQACWPARKFLIIWQPLPRNIQCFQKWAHIIATWILKYSMKITTLLSQRYSIFSSLIKTISIYQLSKTKPGSKPYRTKEVANVLIKKINQNDANFFSIIITRYIDSLVTNILKVKVNKTRQHRTQNLQKAYTAYCKFCTQIEHKNINYIEKKLNAKYLIREREKEKRKKKTRKNQRATKAICFFNKLYFAL